MNRINLIAAAILGVLVALLPGLAVAEPVATEVTGNSSWQFAALVYFYYADVNGKATFPNGASSEVSVSANDIINNLKFGVLGSFEARKENWGVFTDLIYLDAGQFKSQVHNFTIGNIGLPADVSASANFDLKSIVWTLAGSYRVVARPNVVLDLLAGARLLDVKAKLDWTLNGNIGPIPLPGRAGTAESKDHWVDGVVGIKGRVAFGPELKWFAPYYADVGTGDSDLTWQLFGGLGYSFNWGQIIGGWRYVDYKFKSNSALESQSFNGPMLGVAFHW
jgi:hypothetical protein